MIFIPVLLVLVGIFLTYLCRKELALAWASRHWPRTTGQICGSIVHEGIGLGMTTDGTMAPADSHFREIELVFTYLVSGQRYESSRFSFSARGWQENTHYYEEGEEVTVYYCPKVPSIAVLQPGMPLGLLAGPGLVALGLGIVIYALCRM